MERREGRLKRINKSGSMKEGLTAKEVDEILTTLEYKARKESNEQSKYRHNNNIYNMEEMSRISWESETGGKKLAYRDSANIIRSKLHSKNKKKELAEGY